MQIQSRTPHCSCTAWDFLVYVNENSRRNERKIFSCLLNSQMSGTHKQIVGNKPTSLLTVSSFDGGACQTLLGDSVLDWEIHFDVLIKSLPFFFLWFCNCHKNPKIFPFYEPFLLCNHNRKYCFCNHDNLVLVQAEPGWVLTICRTLSCTLVNLI